MTSIKSTKINSRPIKNEAGKRFPDEFIYRVILNVQEKELEVHLSGAHDVQASINTYLQQAGITI